MRKKSQEYNLIWTYDIVIMLFVIVYLLRNKILVFNLHDYFFSSKKGSLLFISNFMPFE